jgi:hypothetical protein
VELFPEGFLYLIGGILVPLSGFRSGESIGQEPGKTQGTNERQDDVK